MKKEVCSFLKKHLFRCFPDALVLENNFSILFPKYKEKYIQESWGLIQTIFDFYNLRSKLNLKFGLIRIQNYASTVDPFVVMKARDFLKLVSRSVPIQQAAKIFDNRVFCDIVKISGLISHRDLFLKRRKRLVGVNGITIRSIEMITRCYILVQGNTVSCIGCFPGIKEARKIIQSSMLSIHPVLCVKISVLRWKFSHTPDFSGRNWQKCTPFFEKNKFCTLDPIKKNLKDKTKPVFFFQRLMRCKYEKKKLFYKKELLSGCFSLQKSATLL